MTARSSFQDFARRFEQLAASTPLADIERNSKALLSHALARMDLVTREEFDAQAAVLARTREALVALEQRVAALEAGARGPD
jgi:ubiquinone biosynthesis accessory factor UbiK